MVFWMRTWPCKLGDLCSRSCRCERVDAPSCVAKEVHTKGKPLLTTEGAVQTGISAVHSDTKGIPSLKSEEAVELGISCNVQQTIFPASALNSRLYRLNRGHKSRASQTCSVPSDSPKSVGLL